MEQEMLGLARQALGVDQIACARRGRADDEMIVVLQDECVLEYESLFRFVKSLGGRAAVAVVSNCGRRNADATIDGTENYLRIVGWSGTLG